MFVCLSIPSTLVIIILVQIKFSHLHLLALSHLTSADEKSVDIRFSLINDVNQSLKASIQFNSLYKGFEDNKSTASSLDGNCTFNSSTKIGSNRKFVCGNGYCLRENLRCNGIDDCLDGGNDEVNCSKITKCGLGMWECANGNCIDLGIDQYSNPLCDSFDNCNDWSDELNCTCKAGQLRCRSSGCFWKSQRCDDVVDCFDGSDEANCSLIVCDSNEFRCFSGQCISAALQCDGIADCKDGSDEKNCVCSLPEFLCDSGTKCLKRHLVCDSVANCQDGIDERDCSKSPNAGVGNFQCKNGYIVKESQICDTVNDCLDWTDEIGCVCQRNPSQVKCNRTNICIWQWKLCDGNNDCVDGEDEKNCSCAYRLDYRCANSSLCIGSDLRCDYLPDCPMKDDEINCPKLEDSFVCSSNNLRIHRMQVCDGRQDCPEWEDEKLLECAAACKNSSEHFLCLNGWQCVHKLSVCDRTKNCLDGSDEPSRCEFCPKATHFLCPNNVNSDKVFNDQIIHFQLVSDSKSDERNEIEVQRDTVEYSREIMFEYLNGFNEANSLIAKLLNSVSKLFFNDLVNILHLLAFIFIKSNKLLGQLQEINVAAALNNSVLLKSGTFNSSAVLLNQCSLVCSELLNRIFSLQDRLVAQEPIFSDRMSTFWHELRYKIDIGYGCVQNYRSLLLMPFDFTIGRHFRYVDSVVDRSLATFIDYVGNNMSYLTAAAASTSISSLLTKEVCILKSQLCNRIFDCPNGEDELGCECASAVEVGCGRDGFQSPCTSKQLLLQFGIKSCSSADNSPFKTLLSQSLNQSIWDCLALHQSLAPFIACDGLQDCLSGQDEHQSLCTSCRQNEFACTAAECIPMSQKCDGFEQCSNGKDEHPSTCYHLVANETEIISANRSRPLFGALLIVRNGTLGPYCVAPLNSSEFIVRKSDFEKQAAGICQLLYKNVELESYVLSSAFSNFASYAWIGGADLNKLIPVPDCRKVQNVSGRILWIKCRPTPCNAAHSTTKSRRVVGTSLIENPSTYNPSVVPIIIEWHIDPSGSFVPVDDITLCTGVIVGERWVLTAGHCVTPMFQPKLGKRFAPIRKVAVLTTAWRHRASFAFAQLNFKSPIPHLDEILATSIVTANVSKVYINPDFQRGAIKADLALLYLEKAMQYRDDLRPACFPSSNDIASWKQGTNCFIAGYGLHFESEVFSAEVAAYWLSQANLNLVSQQECLTALKNLTKESIETPPPLSHQPGPLTNFTSFYGNSFLCAYAPRKGACHGDSGGPLFCEGFDRKQMVLAGITSMTISQCATLAQRPDFFTNISNTLDWVWQLLDNGDLN